MPKITDFQLYCLLVLLVIPLAILEQPHRLLHIAYNNAWLPFIAAIIPGALLILMYNQILRKSSQPFPLLLDEFLGKSLGKTLGLFYVFIFILTCSFGLRVFIEFMKMNVLPATPISIFIGVILLLGLVAIKYGLTSIARTSEISVMLGISFSLVIVLVSLFNNMHLERIHPIAYMSFKSFGAGTLTAAFILGKMMPVLTLAFFLHEKKRALAIMSKVLITYILMLTLVTFAVIVTVGTYPSLNFVFPTFNMIRLARIGTFVQNLDIVFITVWIIGIFEAVTIPWFMACYTIQKIFNLSDYRFLAAPTTIIIGILSIIVSNNNLEIVLWSLTIIPIIYMVFYILVPFILFIISLFKAVPDFPTPEPANSKDTLNKEGIPS